MQKHIYKAGKKVIVFNAKEWSKTGDVGNNEQFFQKAEILMVRHDDHGRSLADVKFIESGMISNGHFQSCMKPFKP